MPTPSPSGARKFPRPYSTLPRPHGKESLLIREELYEEDFEDRAFVCPCAWEGVLDESKRRRIVAVHAAPGSGKSTLAAWVDWKLSKETAVEYISGRGFQNSADRSLEEASNSLPDETVVLLDDAHLVQPHLDYLMRSSTAPRMRFILLSRPQGFAHIRGIPEPIDLTAAANAIAQELARKYTQTSEEFASLLSESQGDLVFTKWLLGALQQHPSQRKPTLDASVIAKLKEFWDLDLELLRLVLVLSAYRWLELPCCLETLTAGFAFASKTVETVAEELREATLDVSTKTLSLDRHPKLAGLFQRTANKFPFYTADVLKPTCDAFRINPSILAEDCFGHAVLGLAVGSGALRASDVVDRLPVSTSLSECVAFCKTAACIESKLSPAVDGLDSRAIERRLTIAFAAYDAMRRQVNEEQAWRLLRDLRSDLGVAVNSPSPFERNGYFLYQIGFHFLLTNQLDEAVCYLNLSAQAEDLWARQQNAPLHFGKAAMSRIAAARATADVLLSTGSEAEDPKPDIEEIAVLAEKLDAERVCLEMLVARADGVDWYWLQRWHLNALLHLAELRACLGNCASVEMLTNSATAVGAAIRLEPSTRESARLAQGTLAFHERRFEAVVDLLEDIPAKQQKAGERSGRFAQLLAISYRELGNLGSHNRWCQWLANECPADKANGPAVAWAKAVLKSRTGST